MRRLLLLLAALPAAGCTYAGARACDFADILRLEGQVGYGLQAHVTAGEFVHAGVGSSREWHAGLVYGRATSGASTEHHLPISYIRTLVDPEYTHVHSERPDGAPGEHLCYMLFPGSLNPGSLRKDPVHYFDVEVGFLALFLGVDVGFSLLEFLDFVVGLFKFSEAWTFMDPAGDDPWPRRDAKRLWYPRKARPSTVTLHDPDE